MVEKQIAMLLLILVVIWVVLDEVRGEKRVSRFFLQVVEGVAPDGR